MQHHSEYSMVRNELEKYMATVKYTFMGYEARLKQNANNEVSGYNRVLKETNVHFQMSTGEPLVSRGQQWSGLLS